MSAFLRAGCAEVAKRVGCSREPYVEVGAVGRDGSSEISSLEAGVSILNTARTKITSYPSEMSRFLFMGSTRIVSTEPQSTWTRQQPPA